MFYFFPSPPTKTKSIKPYPTIVTTGSIARTKPKTKPNTKAKLTQESTVTARDQKNDLPSARKPKPQIFRGLSGAGG